MPACVRAARSATRTGLSAATSSFASSATAPASPCGGATQRQLRDPQHDAVLATDRSCSSVSATSTTGPDGGVIETL